MLQGLMMRMPLLISSLIRHADRHHGDVEIVSRRVEGDMHRCTYRELHRRSRQLANALEGLGIRSSDRVATLAWNGYRHMELYFAVSGSGSVLHTINPRLHPEQVAWIINHAEDKAMFFDLTFLPLIEAVAPHCRGVQHWVAMSDRAHMPETSKLANLLCYEDIVGSHSDRYEWPEFDENTASSICYTSGTTGHPKGALYSHRSTLLHTMAAALPDALNISARDAILPVVPMFHVNAWGLPYVGPMVGAKIVYPGPHLDGKSLYELFEAEKVTCSAGVPTVWQGLLAYTEANGLRFSTMNRTVIGGSACPPAMIKLFQEKYGVHVLHAWGMTEMSPLGTSCTFKQKHAALHRGRAHKGAVQAGARALRRRHEDRRRRRRRPAVGRNIVRRPAGAWAVGRARVLQVRQRQSAEVRRCRSVVVPDRRCGHDRSRRLHADHRSQQGRHQVGRRVDQLDRHRERRGVASGRGRWRPASRSRTRSGTSARCWWSSRSRTRN